MRLHLSTSSLLPILVAVIIATSSPSAACLMQDNPFKVGEPQKSASTLPESESASAATESPRFKKFQSQLREIEKEFGEMLARQQELQNSLAREIESRKLDRLKGPDGKLNERVGNYWQKMKTQDAQLAVLRASNLKLRQHIAKIARSASDAKSSASKATENRNEMHQTLFENLILSDDPAQQQLGFEHLFACTEKYQPSQIPIDIYSVKIAQRVSQLTSSDTPAVKRLASRSLFKFKRDNAIELGIQFGTLWQPLEQSKSSNVTSRIYQSFDEPCDVVYDEVALIEVAEQIRDSFGFGVRLAKDVDEDLSVSYDTKGRTLFDSFGDMLAAHDLGFAVFNDEVVIMNNADPQLKVTATYNIAGLSSLAQVETKEVLKMLQQTFKASDVKLNLVGDNMFTAITTEPNQRQIQKKLASLASSENQSSK